MEETQEKKMTYCSVYIHVGKIKLYDKGTRYHWLVEDSFCTDIYVYTLRLLLPPFPSNSISVIVGVVTCNMYIRLVVMFS